MTVEININTVPKVIDTEKRTITEREDDVILVTESPKTIDRHLWEVKLTGTGPQGPPGPPGPSAGAFLHTQVTPSDIWTVVHPFNRQVSVTVYDETGCVVRAAVVQISPSTVEIHANSPFSGVAVIL